MEPKIWGPPAWTFLHSVTFQYPDNPTELDKQKYQQFFESLKYTLPCPTCKEHYSINFEKLPIRLNTRDELIKWLIDIHNEVNIKNNKKVYSYDEVFTKYTELYEDKKTNNNIILLILLFLIIGYYYYKNYYKK
jgi:hypothetical protein